MSLRWILFTSCVVSSHNRSVGDIWKIIYLGFEKSQRSVTYDSLRYTNILTYLLTYLLRLHPLEVTRKLRPFTFTWDHLLSPSKCRLRLGFFINNHLLHKLPTTSLMTADHTVLSAESQWAFSAAGLSVGDSRTDYFKDPDVGKETFRQRMKTILFVTHWRVQSISGSTTMHYTNSLCHYHCHIVKSTEV